MVGITIRLTRILLILALMAVSVPAHSSRWFPLETTLIWVYARTAGGTETAIIAAPEPIAGSFGHPQSWVFGVSNYYAGDAAEGLIRPRNSRKYRSAAGSVLGPAVACAFFSQVSNGSWVAIRIILVKIKNMPYNRD